MKLTAWQHYVPEVESTPDSIHVDLGAGKFPRNPFRIRNLIATDFYKVDESEQVDYAKYDVVDLTRPLPYKNDSIFSFSAFDVLEHIPRWERLQDSKISFPFVQLMSEIHRCLIPGGYFIALTPAYPSPAAFQDPTHVNVITRETLEYYFSGEESKGKSLGYGFNGNFEILINDWLLDNAVATGISFDEKKIEFDGISARLKSLIRSNRYIRGFSRIVRGRSFFLDHPSHLLWVVRKPSAS